MIDNALLFILSYLGLIAMGTLAVGGWFFTTRGWTTTLPNGSVKKGGKIFKGVYFYFMKEVGTQKFYYTGEQLRMLAREIKLSVPDLSFTLHEASISTTMAAEYFLDVLVNKYCNGMGVFVNYKGDGYFVFYKEQPVYRFPEWVRDPMAKCATCFSSVYGSIFYWIAYQFVGDYLFSWMGSGFAPAIFWIIFCFSLAIPLTALAKKYN